MVEIKWKKIDFDSEEGKKLFLFSPLFKNGLNIYIGETDCVNYCYHEAKDGMAGPLHYFFKYETYAMFISSGNCGSKFVGHCLGLDDAKERTKYHYENTFCGSYRRDFR